VDQAADQAKHGMLLMGVAMAIAGAAIVLVSVLALPFGGFLTIGTGITMIFWGIDLCVNVWTGKSLFDHAAIGYMNYVNSVSEEDVFSEQTIENFSFWHFCSDRTMDLFLQEFVANSISLGVSRIGTGKAAQTFSKLFGLKKLSDIASTGAKGVISRLAGSTIGKMLRLGLRLVIESILEAIYEMLAFDSMTRLDTNERPLGGNSVLWCAFLATSMFVSHISSNYKALGDYAIDEWTSDAALEAATAEAFKQDNMHFISTIRDTITSGLMYRFAKWYCRISALLTWSLMLPVIGAMMI